MLTNGACCFGVSLHSGGHAPEGEESQQRLSSREGSRIPTKARVGRRMVGAQGNADNDS